MPALGGCGAPLPAVSTPGTTPEARALLEAGAAAHGLAAFRGLHDVSVGYEGLWPPIIGRLQPVLTDQGFRVRSEERLLPRADVVAQLHTGPAGRKQVVRRSAPPPEGTVRVWVNTEESRDPERLAASALVADGYALFLLGPMLLAGGWATTRALALEHAGAVRILVGGRAWTCDVLLGRMAPGLGSAAEDRVALYLDREERLMRRVRFGLEGLESTRGAVAEVDCWDHVALRGVRWPTRFHERLLRPAPLPVHTWQMTGLDLDRGLALAEVDGPDFLGRAAVPAAALG